MANDVTRLTDATATVIGTAGVGRYIWGWSHQPLAGASTFTVTINIRLPGKAADETDAMWEQNAGNATTVSLDNPVGPVDRVTATGLGANTVLYIYHSADARPG